MSNNYKLHDWKRMSHDTPKIWDVNDLLERLVLHGEKTMFKYFERNELKEMKYCEFHNMVTNVAAGITALDLNGKRIAVIGETSPQWLATYLGALASGSVIIPMDKELAVTEIEKFLSMVEADAIVYSKSFNEKLEPAMSTHPSLKHFIAIEAPANIDELPKVTSFDKFVEIGQAKVEEGFSIKMTTSRESYLLRPSSVPETIFPHWSDPAI